MMLTNANDGIQGERIVCVCRAVRRERVIAGSHAHRAIELVVEGTPAKCFILKAGAGAWLNQMREEDGNS